MRAAAIFGYMLVSMMLFSGCGAQEAPAKATEEAPPEVVRETPASAVDQIPSYTDIPPAEAKKLIGENPDLVIIDVGSHVLSLIPGAIVLPVEGTLNDAVTTLDPEGQYLVYARYDTASVQGAQKLVDAGFRNVYRLLGNYQAWKAAGYEVEIWVPTFEE